MFRRVTLGHPCISETHSFLISRPLSVRDTALRKFSSRLFSFTFYASHISPVHIISLFILASFEMFNTQILAHYTSYSFSSYYLGLEYILPDKYPISLASRPRYIPPVSSHRRSRRSQRSQPIVPEPFPFQNQSHVQLPRQPRNYSFIALETGS
jgi:hypothetical protein